MMQFCRLLVVVLLALSLPGTSQRTFAVQINFDDQVLAPRSEWVTHLNPTGVIRAKHFLNQLPKKARYGDERKTLIFMLDVLAALRVIGCDLISVTSVTRNNLLDPEFGHYARWAKRFY